MPNFKHGMPSHGRANLDLSGVLNEIAFIGQISMVRTALGDDGVKKFIRETERRQNLPEGSLDRLANAGNL